MVAQVAIPVDQYDYLANKAIVLNSDVPTLLKNLLVYGRLTPETPNTSRRLFFAHGRLTPRASRRSAAPHKKED